MSEQGEKVDVEAIKERCHEVLDGFACFECVTDRAVLTAMDQVVVMDVPALVQEVERLTEAREKEAWLDGVRAVARYENGRLELRIGREDPVTAFAPQPKGETPDWENGPGTRYETRMGDNE